MLAVLPFQSRRIFWPKDVKARLKNKIDQPGQQKTIRKMEWNYQLDTQTTHEIEVTITEGRMSKMELGKQIRHGIKAT